MTTAIIGVGNIGGALTRHLVRGGEQVMLAAREESNAAALAGELGPLASAATVQEAIEAADVVVFAVWFDVLKQLITEDADLLDGKVVADPSNPIGRPVPGVTGGGDAARRRPLRQGVRHAHRRLTRQQR
jgi:predicted dinucleotide-binding enzyme